MKPKQLIKLERGDKPLVLNEDILKDILKKVGTSRVALISVTGSARSGKSYFLNYVLRYFSWEQDDEEDWMGWANPNMNLEGFEWRGGKNTVTSGVWIWPEPLMVKTSNGETIALLLLDTQGTLNEFTTEEESILLTSFCLLLSSVTIYNVKNDIEHENFQLIKKSLQLCSEISKEDPQFQELLFTVRDWKEDNGYGFGVEDGGKYLEEKLEVKPGLTEDAKISKELIRKAFKNINCILFPDPGEKVKNIAHKGFLAEVASIFSTVLDEIPTCFQADNLHRETVARSSMAFIQLLQNCTHLLNGYQAQAQIKPAAQPKTNSSHLQAFELYKQSFEKHPAEFFYAQDVKIVHDAVLQRSVHYLETENADTPFREMVEIKSRFDEMVQQYYLQVISESEAKRKRIEKVVNDATTAVMETYFSEMKISFAKDSLSENHIQLKHNVVKDDCLSSFTELIPKKYRHLDFQPQLKILDADIDDNFAKMKRNWESRKRAQMATQWELSLPTAIEEYKNLIKNAISGHSFLDADFLRKNHEKAMKLMLDKYCSSLDFGDSTDELQKGLIKELNEIFLEFDRTNNEKMIASIEGKLGKSFLIATGKYKKELVAMKRDVNLTEENFIQKIDGDKDKIIGEFLNDVKEEPEGIKTEFSNKLELELNRIRSEALNKFQETRKEYLSTIEGIKKTIQEEMVNILDSHSSSVDSLTVRKTEELGKNQQQEIIDKFNSLSTNGNLPLTMLTVAKNETIDLLKSRTQSIADDGKLKIEKYKRKVNELVQRCLTSYQTQMENLSGIDSEELLGRRHQNSITGLIEELKNKCAIKDETWLQPFINDLREKIESFYISNVKKAFLFEMGQINLQLDSAKMEATKLYREEMDDYFKKKSFTNPADLLLHHTKLCTKISKLVLSKFKLNPELSKNIISFLDKDFKAYEDKNKMNTPTNDPAIGIDLGTTYTCVAIYEKGVARVIPNEKGSFTFPSYVAFTPTGEVVGHPAKEMAHIYPQNTIFDAKRLIGRRFKEEAVQRDIKNWPFTVVDDKTIPKIKVQTKDGEKTFPPEVISAKILNHVKAIAEKHLGKKIKKAVITVPAYFNDGQRQATKDAGEIAGLEVLQIINEPTAAAMAYHLNTKGVRHERNVLVYDLGGGTFDVVVLNMKPGGHIEVKSVNGDTHLGGEDFDDNLLEEMIKRYKAKHGVDLSAGKNSLKEDEKANTARILRRLRNACEMTKINISGGTNTSGEVNVAALVGSTDLLEPVTRKEFEDLNLDLFLKTLDVVRNALKDAKVQKGDIHDIVLVGGSTRIPKVQEMLTEYFDGKVLHATVNPDEAVACGAAIQAAILNGNQEQILKNISLKDVTPLSLGTGLFNGTVSTIIKRNTPLPAKKTETYGTAADYQDTVLVDILEGEEKMIKDNHLLGDFLLTGIPKKRMGVEKVLVTMEVDIEGILKVTAVCASTGTKNNITIEDARGRLSTEEKRALKEEFGEE